MISEKNEIKDNGLQVEDVINITKNIVFIGTPGCGKTTIGKMISEILKMPFCDIDEYIENKEQKTINEIFKSGEDAFRKIETEAIKEVSTKASTIISTGGGAVKIQENMEFLSGNSLIIFLNRPIENIAKDINMATRPLLKDGISKLYSLYEERLHLYKKYCQYEVLNDGDIEDVINQILHIIKRHIDN